MEKEKEKLRWEKVNYFLIQDFSNNWNHLKIVNTHVMNDTPLDLDYSHTINSQHSEGFINSSMTPGSIFNEITSIIHELESNKNLLTNKHKIQTNLSYNFNYFRNLILVIDFTERLNLNDYKPTRHKFLFKKLESFIKNFFKYNFISTITVVFIKDSQANIMSIFNNDPNIIIENLKREEDAKGFSSIYNALLV